MSSHNSVALDPDIIVPLYDRISCIVQALYDKLESSEVTSWTIFDRYDQIVRLECLQQQVTSLLAALNMPAELPYR